MTPAATPVGPPVALTWVVGAGGLLGSALTTRLRANGGTALRHRIDWSSRRTTLDLADGLTELITRTRRHRLPWRIAWCAGAGVTGTSAAALERESDTLASFLDILLSRGDELGPGTFFLSSSAGGLYAGTPSHGDPYSERDEPIPLSPYGEAKLAGEIAVRRYARRTGNQVQIGRIANLYGPGQNLSKGQGLISALCRAAITRQPVSVYVSLDTIRDYLFVDDCAAMIADMLDLGHPAEGNSTGTAAAGRESKNPPGVVLKVLASQQGTTIASLIAACRGVFKRPPLLILGASANARFQVQDLRLRSFVWPEIDRRTLTPLPAGIAATAASILRSAQVHPPKPSGR